MTSFVRSKFNRLLAVATMTMSVNYIVMLSGSVIVGNLVGADGLAALNVCTPAFGLASFLASLLSVGAALVFSRAMGEFDESRAARVFSQTIFLAVVMGGCIYALMGVFGSAFFDFSGVVGVVRHQAESYWRYQSFAMALTPSVLVMEAFVFSDGDNLVAAFAGIVHVLGSIGLSVLCTLLRKDAGSVALGAAITMCLVLAVASLHFLRKNNHLKFVRGFSFVDLKETLAASLADSTIYLCWGVLILIVNKFTVVRFGQDALALVALAASVVEFSIVFDGVGEALIPLGGMYSGEGNKPALRCLAAHAARMASAEGFFFGVIFFAAAPFLAGWYGIRGEASALLPEAVRLIRILAFAMPFMGLLMMVNTHFLVVRHIRLAVSVTVVKDFLFPACGALTLGSLFGLKGLWFGFALGYALAAVYPFVTVRAKYGKDLFPWLIEPDDGKSVDFTCRIDGRAVEVYLERVTSERTRLILRYEGEERSFAPEALARAKSVRSLNTLGCNRTEYILERNPSA